ncbi:MAG: 1-deoxy-D-xylulose-5-phosphate reductoisomerase [Endomicrobium sp.]|jgi:1-deoxy-D-xylulose-5-phosphate reductoisomerase|nr:1-deoxy-D-xylulose-5-phosphate reductoisomerase [Endomicrobium sp.]
MKKITVLGSSGSIGLQTLDVVSKMSDIISVQGLSVGSNIETLKLQIKKFNPKAVSVSNFVNAQKLKKWCVLNNLKTNVYNGDIGLKKLATIPEVDMVVVALVGVVGLKSIEAAIKAKKNIAIANKEVLVMAGDYIMKLVTENRVLMLPIDSEHSAIFQCCANEKKSQIKKIILTASGGPFYWYNKDFSKITVKQALNHPRWKMGRKITIDSATLMNKGFESIEASVLFGISIDKIEVIIHPQSIVHSMVEYIDGSVIAQLSNPDMRIPIQYALTYPERMQSNIKTLDFTKISELNFYKPDFNKFPCLKLAYSAAREGYTMPAVMNAANEIAVSAFLNREIKFNDIYKIIDIVMKSHKISKKSSLKVFQDADSWARQYSYEIICKHTCNIKNK